MVLIFVLNISFYIPDTYFLDTIWALTSFLLVIHLYFHDYGYMYLYSNYFLCHYSSYMICFRNAVSERFTAPVSVNAAIFASVCLASRLPSNLHVFVFISFAIETFALFPTARYLLRVCFLLLLRCSHFTNKYFVQKFSVEFHIGLTLLMFLLAAYLVMEISTFIAIVYIVSILSITFVGPSWLIFIQKYKKYVISSLLL